MANNKPMTHLLSIYMDDVRVAYGDVCDFYDGDALIQKANEWAGKDNWNRLELMIEENHALNKFFGEEVA
jgi:hypothetical protein